MTHKHSISIILCLLLALLFLTGCDKASLSNRAAGDIIKAHFDNGRLLSPMRGTFNVVGGSFDWSRGTLSESSYRAIIALSRLDLVTLTVDRDYENYKKGNGFSWEQWQQQTQGNVIAKVSLIPTKAGLELASAENKNLLQLPMGTFTITEVTRNDKREKGVNIYRIVMVKYSATWNPLFQQFMELSGEKPQAKRKAMTLLKWDSFNSQWVVVATDLANEDQNFTTDNAQRGLESPQGTAQESTSPPTIAIEPSAIQRPARPEVGETERNKDYRSLGLDPSSLGMMKQGAPSTLDSEVKEELGLLVGGWLQTLAVLGARGFGDSNTFRSRDAVLAGPLMRLRKNPVTPKAVIAAAERAQKTMQIAAVYASEKWPRQELAKALGFSEILRGQFGFPDTIACAPKELALRLGGSWLAVLEAAQIQLPKNDNLHESLAAFAKVPALPESLPYATDHEMGARQFIDQELTNYLTQYQDSWFGEFGSHIAGDLSFRQFTDRSVSVQSVPPNTPDADWAGEVIVSFGRTRVYSPSGKSGSWNSWSQRPEEAITHFKLVRERGAYYVESVTDFNGKGPHHLPARGQTALSHKRCAEFLFTTAYAQIEVGLDVQVLVPAGRYYVGDSQEGAKAQLGGFEIDKYEVSIGEYAKFTAWCEKNPDREHEFDHPHCDRKMPHVNDDVIRLILNAAQGGRHVFKQDANPARGMPADSGVAIDLNSPMVGVTFWDAYAYAHWRGKIIEGGAQRDLPTEEEWEAAARGPRGFKYPWGDEMKLGNFNSNQGYNPLAPGGTKTDDGYNYWAPVDKFTSDVSEFNVVGMAGNVCEWVYRKEGVKEIPLLKGGSFASDPIPMYGRILKIPAEDAWFVRPANEKRLFKPGMGAEAYFVGDDVTPSVRSLYIGFRTVKRK